MLRTGIWGFKADVTVILTVTCSFTLRPTSYFWRGSRLCVGSIVERIRIRLRARSGVILEVLSWRYGYTYG